MKRIVILGAGESGAGAAVLAKKEGFDVFVSDMSKIGDKYKKLLDNHQIEWEEGQHTEEKILNADEIIKSPGIPDTAPIIQKIIAKGIHIISEIEFAGRYTNSKMICITGSNGKTTTTSLIYHIFKEAGYDAGLAGNIGNSLALQVAEDPHEYYIIELSSFQLDNMYDFRANIAILLNITPDHLDRYGFEMQNYVDAKMRIIQNQTPKDAFIYWADDPVIKRELEKYDIKAIQYPFSELKENGVIGYIEKGQYKIEEPEPFNMEQESLSLTGKHNIYNSLAAGIAANVAGIKKEEIRKSLSDFPGVEHRLEKVCMVRGVQYINDSKATNVDACWYALESMKTKVILIIGGKDKGNDYEPIKPLVKEKCSGLVYLGADNQKLHDNFDHMGIPVRDTHSMKECMEACYEMAQPGETVLLSPCCASFDLFKNMDSDMNKKIGNIFKGDKVIWMVFFFLCMISIVEVFSASSNLTYKSQNYIGPIAFHTVTIVIGALVAVVTLNIPCRYFKLMTPFLLIISGITLLWVLVGGESINGANRVISLPGGITFQPSEIAKGTMVLITAQILSAMQREEGADKKAFKYILWIVVPTAALIGIENLSTAALLLAVIFLMMFIGRVPMSQMVKLVGAAGLVIVLFLTLVLTLGSIGADDEKSTQTVEAVTANTTDTKVIKGGGVFHRFVTWRNRIVKHLDKKDVSPLEYDLDKDAQVAHANIAIVSSNIIGKGPGQSVERDFLSQAFSDFIFAIVIEELGIVGAAFVVFLYIVLLYRTARIASRCENNFPAFFAMGLALLLVVQASFNMLVAVGIAPVTGQPLPLISKGGTSTIINCAYIGAILSVSRSAKKRAGNLAVKEI